MLIRRVFACLLTFAFAMPVAALDAGKPIADFIHETWSVDEGLPQSSIQGMAQTGDGYLWFATHEGVARFDGHQFTVFNEGNAPALTGTGISALRAAHDGSLFLGLRDGGLVQYSHGVFRTINPVGGLPRGVVSALAEDETGAIWIGTFGGGVARIADNRSTFFTTANGLPHNLVNAIRPTRSGEVWVGTVAGLVVLRDGAVKQHPLGDSVDDAYISCILEDSQGRLWVSTYGDGLYLREGGRLRHFMPRHGLASDTLQRVFEDRSGSIWIGTFEGLQRMHGTVFETFNSDKGLSNNFVRDLLEDREGNFWIGTDRGIDRLRDGAILTLGARRGIAEEFTRAVLEDRAGNVWVGTAGGLYRLGNPGVRHFGRRDGLGNIAVLSLAEGRDGSLWIGTNAGGPYRLRGGRIDRIGGKLGLGVASVRAIAEARDGSVWLGTNTGLYQWRHDSVVRQLRVADGLPSDQVTSVHEDQAGVLWVATRDGIVLILKDGSLQRHPQLGNTQRTLSVGENAENEIIVSLGSGFAVVAGGKTMFFQAAQGVPGRSYFNVIDDRQGNLWLCSNQGLVRLRKAELHEVASGSRKMVEPILYGRSDGMATAQCNGTSEPAAWRTRDGRLLFATARGLAVVQSIKNRLPNLQPPPVHITAVKVDAEQMPLGNTVEMMPGKHRIEFNYVGLNYADPDKVRYRYRLHGFDQGWVDVGSERSAVYTNLQPGNYRFQVIAGNGDGVWNEDGATIAVAYRPHFWQQVYFQFLLALLVLVLALSAYLARVRQLSRQAGSLRKLVDERTRDLEREKEKLVAAHDEKASLLVTVKEQSEAYERLSKQDGLTGLANRRELDRLLALEFERAWRNKRPLCVVLADLDHFKAINDVCSHAVGDDVLRAVSRILLDGCRAIDAVARYGGEEFAIVLPETTVADAYLLCERLREQVASYAWAPMHPQLKVTISFGIATNHEMANIMDHDKLLAAADERLYEAKRQGRNRVCV